MLAGTTSWATSCSLRSRAGPPLRYLRSPGQPCGPIRGLHARQRRSARKCLFRGQIQAIYTSDDTPHWGMWLKSGLSKKE